MRCTPIEWGFPSVTSAWKQCGALLTAARSLKDPTLENEIPPGHIQRGRHTHTVVNLKQTYSLVFFYSIYLFVSAFGKTLKKKSRYPLVRYDMSVGDGEDLLSTKEPHF